MLTVENITSIPEVKSNTPIHIRVFINGQYMATCKIVDSMYMSGNDIILDADLEIFEQEKK